MASWIWIVVALLILLYKSSAVARYYMKFTAFHLISLVAATFPIPLMLLRPRDSRNALIPAYLLRLSFKLIGVRFKVTGHENIVRGSGCVVVINHQSYLDLIVLAELWPIMDNSCVISKKEIFYLWPFGLASWLWGTIFIDRVKADKAQQSINKTGEIIRRRKARVLMFPEGTRNSESKFLPFKKGAFHLAIASKCPIQPVVVSKYHFLDAKTHKFEEGENIIQILPPISTEGLEKENLPELMQQTYDVMMGTFTKISEVTNVTKNNNESKPKLS